MGYFDEIDMSRLGKSVRTSQKYYPKEPMERNSDRLQHSLKQFNIIGGMDDFYAEPDEEYDYLAQAENLAFQAAKLRGQAAQQRSKNTGISLGNIQAQNYPKNKFGDFLRAISGQESGGNYSAVNADSGAAGKYQIMPANFVGPGGWDKEALGRDVSLKFYLNHPRVQEKIARNKLRDYYRSYGPAGAASAWYSGSPDNWNSKTSQGAYPSIHSYVMQVLKAAGFL